MLSSVILCAVFLACGSMADNHGGYGGGYGGGKGEGNGWSSAEPTAAPTAVSTAAANAAETWSSWSAAEASSSPDTVLVQVVQVSNADGSSLKYYPEKIQAPPGSWVQFQFYPKNHTVTQSTFANPCVPINTIMSNVTGINSGPMPPENGMMKVFTIMVNDTKPIWMYCATGTHCQQGMVMSINAPTSGDKTLALYKSMAAQGVANGTANSTSTNNSTESNAPSTDPASAGASGLHAMVGAAGISAGLVAAFALFL